MLTSASRAGSLAERTLVIADDNFHLRSMRRELYMLARTHRAAIVFLHITAPLEMSLSQNVLRPPGERVPEDTILRMAAALEPPGQGSFTIGSCAETSFRVCQLEGTEEVRASVAPGVLSEGPGASEPEESENGRDLETTLSKRATLTSSLDELRHEASGSANPVGAFEKADAFGPGQDQVSSRPLTDRGLLGGTEDLDRAEQSTADKGKDGETTVLQRGYNGRSWEDPVLIVDTSDNRGGIERAEKVWEKVWNVWGQAPEAPPDRAEEKARVRNRALFEDGSFPIDSGGEVCVVPEVGH